MRSFVIIGEKASATGDFLLDDVPGTSGRMDVLLRCLRAGLLSSHGVRADTSVYLVLRQGPRIVRVDGETVQFLRPDERALAVLMRKVLANDADEGAGGGFVEVKPGIALARGDIDVVLEEAKKRSANVFVLDEDADTDLRDIPTADLAKKDTMFVLGDHVGFSKDCLKSMKDLRSVRIGPVSIHTDDAVAVVMNELDRRCKGSKLKDD